MLHSHSTLINRFIISLSFVFIFVLQPFSQNDPVASQFWDLFNSNQLNEASDYIESKIASAPNQYSYYYLRANVNVKKKKPDLVLSDIEKYLKVYPPKDEVYILKGSAYIQKTEYERAMEMFYKALNLAEFDIVKQYCNLKIGSAYILQGNYKMGYEKLLIAESVFSLNIEYLYFIGLAQLNLGYTDGAEQTKNTLMEMHTEDVLTYDFMVGYSQKKHNYADALFFLKKKLSIEPENPTDLELLKKLAIINNDIPMQIMAYEKELELGGNEYECKTKLASLYYSAEEYSKALIFANEAIKLKEDAPENYLIKGDVYLNLKMSHQGCDCYFLALKKGYNTTDGNKFLDRYTQFCEK